MTGTISSHFAELQTGDPIVCNNLTLVPLLHDKSNELNYMTLEDGLSTSSVEVEELEGAASVNDILFRNLSDEFLLLFEGEELLGAMQNRILNTTILVTPRTKATLPVSCVEAGRWHHRHADREKRRFTVANRMHYAKGRALENRAVNRNLNASRSYQSDQHRIWRDIEEKSERMNAYSDSSASDALYESSQSTIDEYLESFEHKPGQVGSIFLVDGEVSGLELFATEETHQKMLDRLIRSYALDAIDSRTMQRLSGKESAQELAHEQIAKAAHEFTQRVGSLQSKQFKGVCAGENIRFEDAGVTGGALVYDDQIMHLCAFSIAEEDKSEELLRT